MKKLIDGKYLQAYTEDLPDGGCMLFSFVDGKPHVMGRLTAEACGREKPKNERKNK